MIANRSAEHWIFRLECVEDRLGRRATVEIQLHFIADPRERAEMMRKDDTNHRESSKHQHPSSREAPNTKLQVLPTQAVVRFGNLVIGISLDVGAWNLELLLFQRL